MSVFLNGIIKIGKYDLNYLNQLINKLNNNQLKEHDILLEYLKSQALLWNTPDQKVYRLEPFMAYDTIEEGWEKSSNVSISGKQATFRFSINFCAISYYGVFWSEFLEIRESRGLVRNFTKEIAKELNGTSIMYVPDSGHYSSSVAPAIAYNNDVESMEELITELKQRNVLETPLETYYLSQDDYYSTGNPEPYHDPGNTYFVEYLS